MKVVNMKRMVNLFSQSHFKNSKISEIYESPFNQHPINYTLTQPDLGLFPISKNNKYSSNDFHIWGKSIKSSIYKNSLNILTKEKLFEYLQEFVKKAFLLVSSFELCELNKYNSLYK